MEEKETRREISLLEHEFVPEHEIMSEEEAEELLRRYGVEKEQLPKIKSKDPVIKEIGAKVGDIIRIKRKSKTSGIALYYRLVVE